MKLNRIGRREFLRNASALATLWRMAPAYAFQEEKPLLPTVPRAADGSLHLVIDHYEFSVDGRAGSAIAVNGSIPGPLLRLREGENAVIHVENRLSEISSIVSV